MRPKWIPYLVILAIVLFTVTFVADRANGHSTEELDAFMEEWTTRADISLSPSLVEEFMDWVERHPHYFNPQPIRPIFNYSQPNLAGVEQWRGAVAQYFAPEDVDRALCLMSYESGGNSNAYNPSGARGLMQVLGGWADDYGYTKDQLFDPYINLMIAADLRYKYGWTQWSPYNRGLCHG